MSYLLLLCSVLVLTSCERIFDTEGDCTVRLHFEYTKNLKWADAFANEVKSVRVYAFDSRGVLVREFAERGTHLSEPGYNMVLSLPDGHYHLVGWCGIDNPDAPGEQFAVPETKAGVTTLEELTCRLHRYSDETYSAVSDSRLEFMFHGELEEIEIGGGTYDYTMSLTKDTNHIRVILQHLSGEDLDVSQFGFRIEDANGYYARDNTLLDDDIITYKAYGTSEGEAGIVRDDGVDSRAMVYSKTAVADLSLGRMMADRKKSMILTITNGEGKDIARIPVIDYVLLAKDYYEMAYNHRMSDQDFLDREDEYMLTLFIDKDMEWYSAEIYILSWRIVLRDYEI